jgi:cytidine deaminase
MTLSAEQATELLAAARGALPHAYAPYSRFRVGAALLARDGRVFSGVNVENSSYSLTFCAERSAVVAAVSAGVREFVAIAVVCEQTMPCMPCGACRQVLHEFAPDLVVVLEDTEGSRLLTLPDLLPHAFRLNTARTKHQPPPSDNVESGGCL